MIQKVTSRRMSWIFWGSCRVMMLMRMCLL